MKESQREPVINFGNIQQYFSCNEPKENIAFSKISEDESLYLLTDTSELYYQKKGKEKNKYFLVPKVNLDFDNTQSKEEGYSNVWCDKFGYHTLIFNDKRVFYFNPTFKDGPKELNLKNEKHIEIYAAAFNDNNIMTPNNRDKIDIIFSDYYSDIYHLSIKLERGEPKIYYSLLYKFRNEEYEEDNYVKDKEEYFGFIDFNLFNMEKNERIIDLKIINSDKENKKQLMIVAITKNTIFKFEGTGSYKEIFDKYTINKDDFQKTYKTFLNSQKKGDFKKSRLQLLKSYSINSLTKDNLILCMGWMSSCGYITEEIQYNEGKMEFNKNINIFPYVKFKFDGTKDYNSIPAMVCQSKLHIFFLYNDCLLVINKLNKNIVHVEYLLTRYNDMYYNESLNSLLLSTQRNVFILNLDDEDKYIWENYVEIGNFELAIKYLPTEEEHLKPKLHRLNADKLLKEEQYDKAAENYSLSDELFESVCVKFMTLNQYGALLKYLTLIKNTKLANLHRKDEIKYFLPKYLIFTWITELLVEHDLEKDKDINLKDFIEEAKHNHTDKYIDKITYYFLLLNYGKQNEFLEYAMWKGDYELIIQSLINHLKYEEVLNNLEKFMSCDIDDNVMKKLIKVIFKYSNYFMKESPIKTINLLEKEFMSEINQDDIIKVIIDLDIKQEIKRGNYDIILNYIRRLIKKYVVNSSNEQNDNRNVTPSTLSNLHNLYILFLSLSDKPEHKKEIIEYLKGPMCTYTSKNNYLNVSLYNNKEIYIDLNFAQKILKNNYCALALVYCLMGRYNESILIALEHNEKDIAIFIAQNIKDDKIKKDIWLRIFKYFKTNNFADAKNILESSLGILKIEDILPFMMDNVKLEELKTDLQACINYYEEGVHQLKQEINDYNQSTEIIRKDIYQLQKKSTCINYTQIKCEKCQKDIMGAKFFLFPCGHIFDTFCLIKILIDYDEQNIGDEHFRIKVNNIKSLREKIRNLQEKRKKIIYEQKMQSNNSNTFKALFNFINKEQKEEFSKEEEIKLKEYSDNLYRLLKEECVLCGKEMIKSTQIKLGQDENKIWKDLV